jgi:hypothetical protein
MPFKFTSSTYSFLYTSEVNLFNTLDGTDIPIRHNLFKFYFVKVINAYIVSKLFKRLENWYHISSGKKYFCKIKSHKL